MHTAGSGSPRSVKAPVPSPPAVVRSDDRGEGRLHADLTSEPDDPRMGPPGPRFVIDQPETGPSENQCKEKQSDTGDEQQRAKIGCGHAAIEDSRLVRGVFVACGPREA